MIFTPFGSCATTVVDSEILLQKRRAREMKWRTFSLSFTVVFGRFELFFFYFLIRNNIETMQKGKGRLGRSVEERRIKRMTNVKVQRNEKININKISQENSRVARTWRTDDVSGRASVWTVRRNKRQITKLNENKTKRICEVRVDLTGRNPFCQNLELVGGKRVFESRPSFDRLNVFVKYANLVVGFRWFHGANPRKNIQSRSFNEKTFSRFMCADFSSQPSKSTVDDRHHLC